MKKTLLVFLASLLLAAGCAQKVPINTGEDVGMIAIPMKSQPHSFLKFVYHYELSSSANRAVRIKLQPIAGNHFAFSEALPSGTYVFDTSTMYATPYYNTITPVNKEVMPLIPPVEVTIEKGKILVPGYVLEVRVINGTGYSYQQVAEWRELDVAERQDYLKILSKTKNIDGWQAQPAKCMRKWYLPPADFSRLVNK